MRQQHAECDLGPAGGAAGGLRQYLRDSLLQMKLGLVIKMHTQRCGYQHFCQRCQVVDGGCGDPAGIRVVGEMAESFESYQLAPVRDCDRSSGKCLVLDPGLEHGKGRSQLFVVSAEIPGQQAVRVNTRLHLFSVYNTLKAEMKFARAFVVLACLSALSLSAFAFQASDGEKPAPAAADAAGTANFAPIDSLIQEQVNNDGITGAVLAVGHNGRIVHQKAFGYRALSPRREPMTLDTVFDLASLTKVVATAPSALRLVQAGKLRLEEPVAHYIPDFGMNGKDAITVRQLLTHYSGLRPDIDLNA